MSIDRDDCDERQARLDWMIKEFREAQSRRFLKRTEQVVESQPDANGNVSLAGSACDTRNLPRLDDYSR
jgi:hypothetical protein